MELFLDIALSFPQVLFSFALLISCLYWGLVILGAMDVEVLDVGDGLVEGALDGMDGVLDGLDGGADSAADAAADAGIDATSGVGPLLFLANVFRLGKAPLTVSLSLFAFWGWLLGFVLTWLYVGGYAPVPHTVFSVGTLVLASAGAALLMNGSVRPVEPIFKLHTARLRKSLVGEVCEVTTGRVDPLFGQATAQMGGDDLLFPVRCDSPNRLRRGEPALIVSFDTKRQAYVVEPMSAATPEVRTLASVTQTQEN